MEASNICSKVILPFCPSYPEARQLFNRSIQKYPSAIIYCDNEEDVTRAVCLALKAGQSIRIRSGGHNYEGFCIADNKLTIDTSQMKNIKLNGSIIKIGSGISNKELYGFLRQYGYPFPSGTCPTVSAAGLTQGGGWGHSSRMLGYAVFTHKGTVDTLIQTYQYIWGVWFPKSGFQIADRDDFECYTERFAGADHDKSEIDIYFPID